MEKPTETAVLRIYPAEKLTFVIPERDRMITLPRPRLPRRFLPGQYLGETVEVRDRAFIHRLVESEQPGLVGEQLPYGDFLLSVLSELLPVCGNGLIVIEPTAGMSDRKGHRGQTLRRQINQ